MEIDCLICGQIGMCTFVSSPATIQDNNDGSNNQENSKWSKCFCELLGVNTELVPEIEGILQSSYYCNHCIPDLQFIYETFCEIEALRESLNIKRNECTVKLRNASLFNRAERERNNIDPSRQFEDVTTPSDDDDFKVPFEFDFHPNSNSPSQTFSRGKLLLCLQKDLAESRPLRLSQWHENGNNGVDQEELPWILPSNTFEDEYYDPLENISVTQESLNTDLTESVSVSVSSPPELDLKVESENIDESQAHPQPCNIFDDKHGSQVENISVTPQTIEYESENGHGGMLGTACVSRIVEEMKTVLAKTNTSDRIPKPKRFQITINKSTAKVIISNDVNDEQEPSTHFIRHQSEAQDYSATNHSPNSSKVSAEYLPKPKRKPRSDSETSSEEEDDSKDPDYNVREDMPKPSKYKKPNKSERKQVFLPTVLSDQGTVKSIQLLEEKYDELINYYGIKKLMIPVMKLPDDDSDSESENRKIDCKCPIVGCQTRFFKKLRLVEHIRVVHRGMKYPYQCKICNKKYSHTFQYKQHLNIHSKTFPYSCPECDYKSPTRRRLQNHKRCRHSLAKFQCDQCGVLSPTRQSYQTHLRRHSSERPFGCEVCGKSYKTPYELRYHRSVHPELNLEQFKCEVCGKAYVQPYHLKQHMRDHTGDLPFSCDKCDFRGPSPYSLKFHMNKHIEGKPYECEACHARYKNPYILARHKKYECGIDQDSRDFVCDTCGKGFRTVMGLKTHQKLHKIVGKPFLCYICGSSYTKKQNLERHHKTAHKDVEIQESSNKKATDHVSPSALPEISGTNSIGIVDQVEEGQVLFSGPSEFNNEADLELDDL